MNLNTLNKRLLAMVLLGASALSINTISASATEQIKTDYSITRTVPTYGATYSTGKVTGNSKDVLTSEIVITNKGNYPTNVYAIKMGVHKESSWKPSIITDKNYNWDSVYSQTKNEISTGIYSIDGDNHSYYFGTGEQGFKKVFVNAAGSEYKKDVSIVELGVANPNKSVTANTFLRTHTYATDNWEGLSTNTVVRIEGVQENIPR